MPELRISDLQVGEAMTRDFGVVRQDMLISELVDLMPSHHWEEVMVLDDDELFAGMITREQIVRIISQGLPQDRPVKTLCSSRTIPLPRKKSWLMRGTLCANAKSGVYRCSIMRAGWWGC